MAITEVPGVDAERARWQLPAGERYLTQEVQVSFKMSAIPEVKANQNGGGLAMILEPPREHFRFLAVDMRNLTLSQQFALGVLLERQDAVYLAEAVMEGHHSTAK